MKGPSLSICAIALLGVFLYSGQAPAAPLVSLSICAGAPGTTAMVPVSFWTDTNVTKLQFDLVYEPTGLATGTPTGGDSLADHFIITSQPAPGVRRVELVSFTNALLTNGVLVFVPFTIATNAPDHDTMLTLTNVTAFNTMNQPLPEVMLGPGTLRIEVPPVFIRIGRSSTGGMYLELAVNSTRTCIIQGATQTTGAPWVSLTTNQPINGQIWFDDVSASAMVQRFYRAKVLQ